MAGATENPQFITKDELAQILGIKRRGVECIFAPSL
jgi:hypothetical protein